MDAQETTTTAGPVSREALEHPIGPAAAVVLATGIGAFTLGLMTTWAEASTGMHDWLEFDIDVGPLSGKTIIATAGFFVSWAVLAALWWRKNPPLRPVLVAAAILLALGFLGTFPTFFQAFASE